jgi:hypothetical protein
MNGNKALTKGVVAFLVMVSILSMVPIVEEVEAQALAGLQVTVTDSGGSPLQNMYVYVVNEETGEVIDMNANGDSWTDINGHWQVIDLKATAGVSSDWDSDGITEVDFFPSGINDPCNPGLTEDLIDPFKCDSLIIYAADTDVDFNGHAAITEEAASVTLVADPEVVLTTVTIAWDREPTSVNGIVSTVESGSRPGGASLDNVITEGGELSWSAGGTWSAPNVYIPATDAVDPDGGAVTNVWYVQDASIIVAPDKANSPLGDFGFYENSYIPATYGTDVTAWGGWGNVIENWDFGSVGGATVVGDTVPARTYNEPGLFTTYLRMIGDGNAANPHTTHAFTDLEELTCVVDTSAPAINGGLSTFPAGITVGGGTYFVEIYVEDDDRPVEDPGILTPDIVITADTTGDNTPGTYAMTPSGPQTFRYTFAAPTVAGQIDYDFDISSSAFPSLAGCGATISATTDSGYFHSVGGAASPTADIRGLANLDGTAPVDPSPVPLSTNTVGAGPGTSATVLTINEIAGLSFAIGTDDGYVAFDGTWSTDPSANDQFPNGVLRYDLNFQDGSTCFKEQDGYDDNPGDNDETTDCEDPSVYGGGLPGAIDGIFAHAWLTPGFYWVDMTVTNSPLSGGLSTTDRILVEVLDKTGPDDSTIDPDFYEGGQPTGQPRAGTLVEPIRTPAIDDQLTIRLENVFDSEGQGFAENMWLWYRRDGVIPFTQLQMDNSDQGHAPGTFQKVIPRPANDARNIEYYWVVEDAFGNSVDTSTTLGVQTLYFADGAFPHSPDIRPALGFPAPEPGIPSEWEITIDDEVTLDIPAAQLTVDIDFEDDTVYEVTAFTIDPADYGVWSGGHAAPTTWSHTFPTAGAHDIRFDVSDSDGNFLTYVETFNLGAASDYLLLAVGEFTFTDIPHDQMLICEPGGVNCVHDGTAYDATVHNPIDLVAKWDPGLGIYDYAQLDTDDTGAQNFWLDSAKTGSDTWTPPGGTPGPLPTATEHEVFVFHVPGAATPDVLEDTVIDSNGLTSGAGALDAEGSITPLCSNDGGPEDCSPSGDFGWEDVIVANDEWDPGEHFLYLDGVWKSLDTGIIHGCDGIMGTGGCQYLEDDTVNDYWLVDTLPADGGYDLGDDIMFESNSEPGGQNIPTIKFEYQGVLKSSTLTFVEDNGVDDFSGWNFQGPGYLPSVPNVWNYEFLASVTGNAINVPGTWVIETYQHIPDGGGGGGVFVTYSEAEAYGSPNAIELQFGGGGGGRLRTGTLMYQPVAGGITDVVIDPTNPPSIPTDDSPLELGSTPEFNAPSANDAPDIDDSAGPGGTMEWYVIVTDAEGDAIDYVNSEVTGANTQGVTPMVTCAAAGCIGTSYDTVALKNGDTADGEAYYGFLSSIVEGFTTVTVTAAAIAGDTSVVADFQSVAVSTGTVKIVRIGLHDDDVGDTDYNCDDPGWSETTVCTGLAIPRFEAAGVDDTVAPDYRGLIPAVADTVTVEIDWANLGGFVGGDILVEIPALNGVQLTIAIGAADGNSFVTFPVLIDPSLTINIFVNIWVQVNPLINDSDQGLGGSAG